MGEACGNRFRGRGREAPTWIIAHRGDSFRAPENTLEAARLGHEAGADAWELDVRLTRDRVPVVLHDASIRRTTDVARRFVGDPRGAAGFPTAEFDAAEILQMDAGSWFVDPAGGPRSAVAFGSLGKLGDEEMSRYASGTVRVPTLAEALRLTVELDWLVNIELKSDFGGDRTLADATLSAIAEAEAADRVLISSFDHEDLAYVAGRWPDVAVGVLTNCPLHLPEDYVRRIGADAYHPSASALGAESDGYRRSPSPSHLQRRTLADLQRGGVPVFVYTVNDSGSGGLADHLAEAGVSGLFTDDPSGLAARWRPGRSTNAKEKAGGD